MEHWLDLNRKADECFKKLSISQRLMVEALRGVLAPTGITPSVRLIWRLIAAMYARQSREVEDGDYCEDDEDDGYVDFDYAVDLAMDRMRAGCWLHGGRLVDTFGNDIVPEGKIFYLHTITYLSVRKAMMELELREVPSPHTVGALMVHISPSIAEDVLTTDSPIDMGVADLAKKHMVDALAIDRLGARLVLRGINAYAPIEYIQVPRIGGGHEWAIVQRPVEPPAADEDVPDTPELVD
jgi:hypothetical protein